LGGLQISAIASPPAAAASEEHAVLGGTVTSATVFNFSRHDQVLSGLGLKQVVVLTAAQVDRSSRDQAGFKRLARRPANYHLELRRDLVEMCDELAHSGRRQRMLVRNQSPAERRKLQRPEAGIGRDYASDDVCPAPVKVRPGSVKDRFRDLDQKSRGIPRPVKMVKVVNIILESYVRVKVISVVGSDACVRVIAFAIRFSHVSFAKIP
jgi:hypothetical protein